MAELQADAAELKTTILIMVAAETMPISEKTWTNGLWLPSIEFHG